MWQWMAQIQTSVRVPALLLPFLTVSVHVMVIVASLRTSPGSGISSIICHHQSQPLSCPMVPSFLLPCCECTTYSCHSSHDELVKQQLSAGCCSDTTRTSFPRSN